MSATEIPMHLQNPRETRVIDETGLYRQLLPLAGARIIELGCGAAVHTRLIAGQDHPASILACEVDQIQHEKNLQISDLPNVRFCLAGAQAIPADDQSADIVLMFKSLHHVPLDAMDRVLQEIRRVLRPGGLAYISEPVYAGDYNALVSLFHDEQQVREAAFQSIRNAVQTGQLTLAGQHFFNVCREFQDFAAFERRVINVTHTEHRLNPGLWQQVRETFGRLAGAGPARFISPMRVDLLRRPV